MNPRTHCPSVFEANHGVEVDIWAVGKLILDEGMFCYDVPGDVDRYAELMVEGQVATASILCGAFGVFPYSRPLLYLSLITPIKHILQLQPEQHRYCNLPTQIGIKAAQPLPGRAVWLNPHRINGVAAKSINQTNGKN